MQQGTSNELWSKKSYLLKAQDPSTLEYLQDLGNLHPDNTPGLQQALFPYLFTMFGKGVAYTLLVVAILAFIYILSTCFSFTLRLRTAISTLGMNFQAILTSCIPELHRKKNPVVKIPAETREELKAANARIATLEHQYLLLVHRLDRDERSRRYPDSGGDRRSVVLREAQPLIPSPQNILELRRA